jgi:hypothetical protein
MTCRGLRLSAATQTSAFGQALEGMGGDRAHLDLFAVVLAEHRLEREVGEQVVDGREVLGLVVLGKPVVADFVEQADDGLEREPGILGERREARDRAREVEQRLRAAAALLAAQLHPQRELEDLLAAAVDADVICVLALGREVVPPVLAERVAHHADEHDAHRSALRAGIHGRLLVTTVGADAAGLGVRGVGVRVHGSSFRSGVRRRAEVGYFATRGAGLRGLLQRASIWSMSQSRCSWSTGTFR